MSWLGGHAFLWCTEVQVHRVSGNALMDSRTLLSGLAKSAGLGKHSKLRFLGNARVRFCHIVRRNLPCSASDSAILRGGPLDRSDELEAAVTEHGLAVERHAEWWRAQRLLVLRPCI